MKIYINGKLVNLEEAFIPLNDRAYLFGEGVFETLRSYEGIPLFLDRHLKRMEWSSTFVGLPFPHPEEIKRAITQTLEANQLTNARIKILLSAKNKGFIGKPLSDDFEINLTIITEEFTKLPQEQYNKGVNLAFVHSVKNDPPPISTIKSMSRISKMIAQREIAEKKSFDGILMNATGQVTETTSSNIFWIHQNKVYTPPTDVGILAGVTREILFEIFKKENIPFSESYIKEDELKTMSEIFITGSTLEVMPVTVLEGRKVGIGKPEKTTLKIQQLYQNCLNQALKEAKTSL